MNHKYLLPCAVIFKVLECLHLPLRHKSFYNLQDRELTHLARSDLCPGLIAWVRSQASEKQRNA